MWMRGKQGMEEDEVEDDVDVSAGASGLGNSEEGADFREIWGPYLKAGDRICKFQLEIQS